MASIVKRPDGHRWIQFVDPEGKRQTLRLGKLPLRQAENVKVRVEHLLAAKIARHAVDGDTARWVAEVPDALAAKLARVGLIPERTGSAVATLGSFLDGWMAARSDYKPASRRAWRQVLDGLVRLLGRDRPLNAITRAEAETYRQSMLDRGLRPTTVHKRLQHARTMFAAAVDQELVGQNPFDKVRHRPGDPSERRAYVPAADVLRVIECAPNTTWKLLLAFSRFAGLRTPSESFSLKWSDIDWERQRIVVPVPKLEHLPGRSHRVIPLFPELRPWLELAAGEAPKWAVHVVPEEYRRRAQGPDGWANANLRTTLGKIIRRAGVEPWPRLWHSLRASCETDLARQFPLAVVAKWLGNTQAVAMRHYVDVTDADFRRAAEGEPGEAEAKQNPKQYAPAHPCTDAQTESSAREKTPVLPGFSPPCRMVHERSVEAMGVEPPQRNTGNTAIPAEGEAKAEAVVARAVTETVPLDPGLHAVVVAWPNLRADVQDAILSLVRRAASGG